MIRHCDRCGTVCWCGQWLGCRHAEEGVCEIKAQFCTQLAAPCPHQYLSQPDRAGNERCGHLPTVGGVPQKRQAVHPVGCCRCRLCRHHRAEGHAGEVGMGPPQRVHQPQGRLRHCLRGPPLLPPNGRTAAGRPQAPVVKGDHLRCQMLSSRQLDAGKVLCYVGKPSCASRSAGIGDDQQPLPLRHPLLGVVPRLLPLPLLPLHVLPRHDWGDSPVGAGGRGARAGSGRTSGGRLDGGMPGGSGGASRPAAWPRAIGGGQTG
mmetsp:Transcript_16616/g.49712  ORF Transcript_16616/g.49712 Transcript_16616/m.49712 type:complete len:262 (+) Transcript_16616:1092-1877(+)